MTTESQLAALREDILEILDGHFEDYTMPSPSGDVSMFYMASETIMTKVQAALVEASDGGFKEGQRVGQYQAADKLYHHVIHIYMFRDGDKKAVAIADSSATDLLKDCEKYLNHNSRVYKDYVRGERYKRMHPEAQLSNKEEQVISRYGADKEDTL